MKKERAKLVKREQENVDTVTVKADEFRLVLTDRYPALEQEDQDNIEAMNETVARLTLEAAMKLLDWECLEVRINGEYLNNLRFADDIVLFSNTGYELQQIIEGLSRDSERVGLKINMQNTKLMFNSLAREQVFRISSQPLESVHEYFYLGQSPAVVA